MVKAFIFDLDGVMVDSDSIWDIEKKKVFKSLFGLKIANKLENKTKGLSLSQHYNLVCNSRCKVSWQEYLKTFDDIALIVYKKAKITKNLDKLVKILVKNNYKLGLVSASPFKWINIVLKRLKFTDQFKCIISTQDTKKLKPKPSPDSYLKAMKKLKVKPKETIILEDTNTGLKAAKASGAYVVCLKEHLPLDYKPKGANLYISSIDELIKTLKDKFFKQKI